VGKISSPSSAAKTDEHPAERIAGAQEEIRRLDLEGVILFHSRDLFYYTGTAQPAYLVILPRDCRLFIRSGLEFARRETWLPPEKVIPERRLEAAVRRMFPPDRAGGKVGVELDLLTVPHAAHLQKALGRREVVDFTPAVLRQRMIKSGREIDSIRRACSAVHAGHEAAVNFLGSDGDKTELQLAAAVENAQRLAGHEGIFFMRRPDFFMGRGPLASGPNLREISGVVFNITGRGLSPAVPAGASRRTILNGDLILIDIPSCVQGYHADQTRMYCLGRPPQGALDLHRRLREVADHLIDHVRPGLSCDQVYRLAAGKAADLGLTDSFLRFPSDTSAHFVGHGLGLDLNEPPFLAQGDAEVLQPDMILALELHLMTPDGLTLKLEDTVRLTEAGCRLLTFSPRELTVI